jgi:uncharacterized protein
MATTSGVPVVDTDTHVTEPADLWTSRMSRTKWGDLIPHVLPLKDDPTREAWFIGDRRAASQVGHSSFGRNDDGTPRRIDGGSGGEDTPQSFATVHPSAFDAAAAGCAAWCWSRPGCGRRGSRGRSGSAARCRRR